MVQYDLNKVYIEETKQDVFLKKRFDMANSKVTKITRSNILIAVERSCHKNDHPHCGSSNIYFL